MLRRTLLYLWAALALGVLAACGGEPVPASPAATTPPDTRVPNAPTAAAASAPTLGVSASPAAAATAVAEPQVPGGGAVPEGLTAEGYHRLGRPDAPVTLVMYSDFL
jgi:hypothetical protein